MLPSFAIVLALASSAATRPDLPIIAADHSYGCIPAEQLEGLRQRAVAGDAASSYALATHHGDCESGSLHDHLFFLRLAGEQGNCAALYEFAEAQARGIAEALKTPGNWRERAKQCAKRSAASEG